MDYTHDVDAGGTRESWPIDFRPEPRSLKPRKHSIITPEMHEKIRRLYVDATGNGEIRAFADRTGIPRWKITKYAQRHGWVARTAKGPDWSDEEVRILERHAHLVEECIQRYLKRAGYSRTVTAITLKRRRMRMLQNLDGMSARTLAQCLGTDESFVRRHIESGRLVAERRGTRRVESQGGDIWWILPKNVRKWVVENVAEIDIRKVDKFWLVDLLTEAP